MKFFPRKSSVVLFLLLSWLVSCSPAPAPTPTPKPATPTPVAEATKEVKADTVNIEVMNFSQEVASLYNDSVVEFNKEYPQIIVKWTTMPRKEYLETMPVLFESKQAPDIFIGQFSLSELLDKGWVRPLAPKSDIPESWYQRWPKNSFIEGLSMVDGEPYTFQLGDLQIWGNGFLFYNRDLFTKAGLDPNKPPQTWTEFKQACQAIKQKTSTYCLTVPTDPILQLHRLWLGFAGMTVSESLFDYQKGKPIINDPRIVELVNFLQSLYAEDLILPGTHDNLFTRQAFGTGQAAMTMEGPWLKQTLKTILGEVKIDVARPPHPDIQS